MFIGELIVFPKNTTNLTLRFQMYSDSDNGISSISSVFDTLMISEDFDYEIVRNDVVWNSEESITVR